MRRLIFLLAVSSPRATPALRERIAKALLP